MSLAARVGLITLIAFILLGSFLIWKSNLFLRAAGYELIGSFENISGLMEGAEIRYRGYKIGTVNKIIPGRKDIRVHLLIKPQVKVPKESSLRIAFDGLIGQKFLEVIPGASSEILAPKSVIFGTSIAGIVDFIDVGVKNLEEAKQLLSNLRGIIEDPKVSSAVRDTIVNLQMITHSVYELTKRFNLAVEPFTDPRLKANFQNTMENLARVAEKSNQIVQSIGETDVSKAVSQLQSTLGETRETLSTANLFFRNLGKINVDSNAHILLGTRANAVWGDVRFTTDRENFLKIRVGENEQRAITLLDILLGRKIGANASMRLGMINSQVGGGIDYTLNKKLSLTTDIFDLNNKPNNPRLRISSYYELANHLDLVFQADNILNQDLNYVVGVNVK